MTEDQEIEFCQRVEVLYGLYEAIATALMEIPEGLSDSTVAEHLLLARDECAIALLGAIAPIGKRYETQGATLQLLTGRLIITKD